ncbi:LOW QUALITY PROTEIN: hypothetical protein HID58_084386 [Brassica napus]|uniref:Uncharacterized protein n=1 Tax=Brassica napus TaxID=3708 RepID=A0ABQ7XMA9_BRANA|nr:LOW QUALITY PROTEIN: hypothetical protein HID58_084386 [Brassica napus]
MLLGRDEKKPQSEILQLHLRLSSLILGSGDSFYTVVESFRLRETVALTAPVSPAFAPGSGGSDSTVLSLVFSPDPWFEIYSLQRVWLAFMVEYGRVFSMTPAEDDVSMRRHEVAPIFGHVPSCWVSVMWRPCDACFSLVLNTCPVHVTHVNEVALSGFRLMGLRPKVVSFLVRPFVLDFMVLSLYRFLWVWSFGF